MSTTQTEDGAFMLQESASFALPAPTAVDAGPWRAVTVHRGMTVQAGDGQMAGHIAAVMLDRRQQQVTHVLLVQERRRLEYRLVSVALIQQVGEGLVVLQITHPAVECLPAWHGAR